jgi:sugar O-acyltransferase (sialic acid O-acetyltransferase NeuD family)
MKTALMILGAGGHAKVLIDILKNQERVEIIGIVDTNSSLHGTEIANVNVLGGEEIISQYSFSQIQLVNGLGSILSPDRRQGVYEKFKNRGYQFYSVIHPFVSISKHVTLGEGVQIMAGSIIQTECVIAENVLINTGVTIDHECQIAKHVHIAPGCVLSGNVIIHEACHIGVGAVIIQGVCVGKHCCVGAGTLVLKNLPTNSKWVGVPAKRIA